MARQIHCVVENADHLDQAPLSWSIQDKMASAMAAPRDVKRSEMRPDFVARDAAGNVGAEAERLQGFKDGRLINLRLARTESVLRVGENAGEIPFSFGAKPDPLDRRGQAGSFGSDRAAAPTFFR
jgi:hypothetical protein